MTNCGNCGRPLGDAFERGECAYPLGVTCVEAARTRPTHDALRRELADAKAEVERLRGEVVRLSEEVIHENHCAVRYCYELRIAEREADDLRRLAWEWCIAARFHFLAAHVVHREADELRTELSEMSSDRAEQDAENARLALEVSRLRERAEPPAYGPTTTAHEVTLRTEAPIDPTALRIVPWGAPVVVQEPGRLVRTEPPIESLGPVPADVPGSLRSRIEWLVRDAVRRGAKLEGE